MRGSWLAQVTQASAFALNDVTVRSNPGTRSRKSVHGDEQHATSTVCTVHCVRCTVHGALCTVHCARCQGLLRSRRFVWFRLPILSYRTVKSVDLRQNCLLLWRKVMLRTIFHYIAQYGFRVGKFVMPFVSMATRGWKCLSQITFTLRVKKIFHNILKLLEVKDNLCCINELINLFLVTVK